MNKQQVIAIIGGGPRGLSVAESIGIELEKLSRSTAVQILLIDDHEPGAGRIWRPTQSQNFLMNTIISQVTIYSGGRDGGPDRSGHGPSLYEWLMDKDKLNGSKLDPNTYASRQKYGEYLREALLHIVEEFPAPNSLVPILGSVRDVIPNANGTYCLEFMGDQPSRIVDAIVIATGHSKAQYSMNEDELQVNSNSSLRCNFISGDSANDFGLERIPSKSAVGIVGMGLGFHDVLSMLTSGRGGRFESKNNDLIYIPSGLEPYIFAGSRSGLPIPARGKNQKNGKPSTKSVFFTNEAVQALRSIAIASGGKNSLSFDEHLEPLILAEIEHTYYSTWVRNLFGQAACNKFKIDHIRFRNPQLPISEVFLSSHGVAGVPKINLNLLARPFDSIEIKDSLEFRNLWRTYLELDIRESMIGNLDSPLKSALDVLRDIRDTLRSAVEFENLSEVSLVKSFIAQFSPLCGLLAAGPPIDRVRQLLAIENAGILNIVGPRMHAFFDSKIDSFILKSESIDDDQYQVTTLIDSRVPFPSLKQTENALLISMDKRGLIRAYQHPDKAGLGSGGVDILPHSFEVIDVCGRANPRIFAIGIPTENPRWFTQVGSATPGALSRFTQDASAVAKGVLEVISCAYSSVSLFELEESVQ